MAESPCGWYEPMTSPTTLAHLVCGRSGSSRWSYIEYRIRRWTGFSPSLTSGRARDTMTDIEYSRKERSISSWISMGSMNPETSSVSEPPRLSLSRPGMPCPYLCHCVCAVRVHARLSPPGAAWIAASDVEEAHVLGIGLDELPAQFDVFAHQYRADLVGDGRLLDGDLEQGPLPWVHSGVPQLAEVHLPQPLQPLEIGLVVGVLGEEGGPGRVVLQVQLLLAHQRRVQGGLGHVDEAAFDQGLHLAEEEGQEQGADVGSVHVGVGQDDHLVIADLGHVEIFGQPGPDGRDERLDLGVLQHLVDPRPLDVQDLAADGKDGLGSRVAGVLGRTSGRVALDDEQLALPRVA